MAKSNSAPEAPWEEAQVVIEEVLRWLVSLPDRNSELEAQGRALHRAAAQPPAAPQHGFLWGDIKYWWRLVAEWLEGRVTDVSSPGVPTRRHTIQTCMDTLISSSFDLNWPRDAEPAELAEPDLMRGLLECMQFGIETRQELWWQRIPGRLELALSGAYGSLPGWPPRGGLESEIIFTARGPVAESVQAGTLLAMSLEEWEWWPKLSCDALALVDVLADANRTPAQFVVLMHAAPYLRVEHVETAVKEARWLRAQMGDTAAERRVLPLVMSSAFSEEALARVRRDHVLASVELDYRWVVAGGAEQGADPPALLAWRTWVDLPAPTTP